MHKKTNSAKVDRVLGELCSVIRPSHLNGAIINANSIRAGLQSLKKIEDSLECPTCRKRLTEKQNKKSSCLRVNGGKLDMVDDFCYLADVMSCDSGAESAVRATIAAAWGKKREKLLDSWSTETFQ